MDRLWWHLIRFIARLMVWAYYRRFRVEGVDRIPRTGPLLLVANHPNALVDAATVLVAIPRPVKFAAKSTLFSVPVLGFMMRALGAVPVYRPRDRTGDARKNLDMFSAFTTHFAAGGVAVVFPEGESHLEPQLRDVKSGPARIAHGAEAATGFELGLQVLPLGLHYEPTQQFRGEVHVRVGAPFKVSDLKDTERREAIRTVQERIADSLRPLVLHLDDVELEPLVRGVAELYDDYQRTHPEFAPRPRAEVVHLAGACLNHFLVTDPQAVRVTQRKLERYRRLVDRSGVESAAIEGRLRRWRTAFRVVWIALKMLLGLPFFLIGCLVGYAPYRLTAIAARVFARREGEVALPFFRIISGAVVFGVFWGILTACVYLWSHSPGVTLTFLFMLIATSYYARFYAERFQEWRAQIEGLVPRLRPGVSRVAAARDDLLTFVSSLAARYQSETGAALLPDRRVRWIRRVPWRAVGGAVLVVAVVWFAWGLKDPDEDVLPGRPSPWRGLTAVRAEQMLDSDARSLVGLLDTLAQLELTMGALRRDFDEGARRYPAVEDDRAVRRAMLSYLTCRDALFRMAWTYRMPERAGEPEASERAFVLGYVAAIELCRRGMQLVNAFDRRPETVRKLNEGDAAWGLSKGTFDSIRSNLANTRIHDELAMATARYRRMRARFAPPTDAVWERIVAAADSGGDVVGRLTSDRWQFKWDAAVARSKRQLDEGRYEASKFFATLIGKVHLREGDLDDGLVSDAQVQWLRDERLEPGDILLERRNWALSNAFLPGFWTHAAIYTGGPDGLTDLGITADPRVAPRLAELARPDAAGHPRLIVEALGPGVVLTSLESSVGEADAVCVLRPRVSQAAIAEAVARAMHHVGKPYDFDFDFFSTDRLVCTELVYQAYDGPLAFELIDVMGRETLPANKILEKWSAERDSADADLEFICFFDAREQEGEARSSDAADLTKTLDRPGLTMLQAHAGTSPLPRIFGIVLAVLFLLGLAFLRRPTD